jgi:hypothetical protein
MDPGAGDPRALNGGAFSHMDARGGAGSARDVARVRGRVAARAFPSAGIRIRRVCALCGGGATRGLFVLTCSVLWRCSVCRPLSRAACAPACGAAFVLCRHATTR